VLRGQLSGIAKERSDRYENQMFLLPRWPSRVQTHPTRKDGKSFCFRVRFRVVILLELLKQPEGKTLEFKPGGAM
jgi:hypothetical protein